MRLFEMLVDDHSALGVALTVLVVVAAAMFGTQLLGTLHLTLPS